MNCRRISTSNQSIIDCDGVYLICGKSRIHNKMDMILSLKAGKYPSAVEVCIMRVSFGMLAFRFRICNANIIICNDY